MIGRSPIQNGLKIELIGSADDRGYSKFNRIRCLSSKKIGMTYFCPTT
jgi:hypothetical protein